MVDGGEKTMLLSNIKIFAFFFSFSEKTIECNGAWDIF
jgi:hypothetical protein